MTSRLKVTEIADPTNGNTAIEIDSNGVVTRPVLPAWRLNFEQQDSLSTNTQPATLDADLTDSLGTDNARFVNGGITASSNTITVPVSGFYQINYIGRGDNIGSGYFQIMIRVNDEASRSLSATGGNSTSTTYHHLALSEVQYLEANDTIDFYFSASSDTSWHFENNSMTSGVLIG